MTHNERSRRLNGDDLLRELQNALEGNHSGTTGSFARLDFSRQARNGMPEIVLAEHKSDAQVIELARRMLDRNGAVLVSRVSHHLIDTITNQFKESVVEHPEGSSMVRIAEAVRPDCDNHARVAVFTAGTSDLPRAQEVRLVAEEMGVQAQIWADMGVAGLHRIVQPFREAIDWGASSIVVVAGMDGALPSVIAGLSPVPVIGLPVSVGYGFGGGGEAALMAMLQTCAPGLTVVNIDNSVGAGIAAARIALQSDFRD